MPRPIPPPLSLTLTVLRSARGWTQRGLAAALGMDAGMLSGYEKGTYRSLSRSKLEELAAELGYRSEDIDLLLMALEWLSAPATGPDPADDLSAADQRRAKQAALRLGLVVARLAEARFVELAGVRRRRQARRAAARLWSTIEHSTAEQRRLLVEKAREFQSWGFCERLCEESERASAHQPVQARELAELALRVAQLTPGDEARRSRHLGYARVFVANARRVGGDLHEAEAEFAQAWALWRAGAAAGDVLPEWRVFDREASLRRGLRQWSAALKLLDQALAVAPAEAIGRILLNRAATYDQAGEVEKALASLHEAAPLIEASGDLRLRCVLRFNLTGCLCHLERYAEAEALLPEVQEIADSLGNALDLIRALWLSGRIAAGRGRKQDARTALEQVRREFVARRMGYDAALVSLELSVLYLEQGRTAEVHSLAVEMAWIFDAQGVHREALAALELFCRAAQEEHVSVDLARRLLSYLERARHDNELRFEALA
jgi:transcriptional regulator with XRE-family HTH domain